MQHRIPTDRLGPRGDAMAEAVGACVHCGFCLPTCPTYRTLGDEMDSPRGRITLMKGVLEGELDLDESVSYIDRCLGCLACVTSCPSGVEYGDLLSGFKAHAEPRRRRSRRDRLVRRLLIGTVTRPGRLRWAARFAGLGRIFKGLLPSPLAAALELMPRKLPRPAPLPAVVPARGARVARVALVRGCAQDVLAPGITRAAARVLARRGVEVSIPEGQGCCGALAFHAGDDQTALRQAAALVDAMPADVDAVLTTAAGCGSGVNDYPLLFAGRPGAAEAGAVAEKSLDVTTFLDQLEPLPCRTGRPVVATYQDACHLAHAQGERGAPRRLLGHIEGLELRSAADWHQCCGSAGIYNLEEPEIAHTLGRAKAETLLATGAELIISGNIGCLSQIDHHLRRLEGAVPIRHTVEVLDLAERGDLG
ncbi:MAG: heterodisulfide reductase-related iron-sulfur binding cluster [Acidobacteriota bacterium]